MPKFLNDLWGQMIILWDKAEVLAEQIMAWFKQLDTSKIVTFIDGLPMSVEGIIQLFRITAIAAAAMGIISLISAMRLNNGLPISKAKQFLTKRKQPVVISKEPVVPVLDLQVMEDAEPTKKPLISYKLTEDAEKLLEKIEVDLHAENGWNIAPGGTPAA